MRSVNQWKLAVKNILPSKSFSVFSIHIAHLIIYYSYKLPFASVYVLVHHVVGITLQWLCQTILVKLVEQIDDVNDTLCRIGCAELQVGSEYKELPCF